MVGGEFDGGVRVGLLTIIQGLAISGYRCRRIGSGLGIVCVGCFDWFSVSLSMGKWGFVGVGSDFCSFL